MLRTAVLTLMLLALMAPVALASTEGHDGGEGLYGPANDKVITNAGFILIAAFPLIAFVLSMIQWRLDKRKDRRLAAARERRAREALRGGR